MPISDPAGHQPLVTTRGYTGHEQLDNVGLVHMNGRVYDPEIGRFLSADPYVQHPFNGQSLNRYSYGLNNPLSYTDPTGFYYSYNYSSSSTNYGSYYSPSGSRGPSTSQGYDRNGPSSNTGYSSSSSNTASSSSSSNSGSGGCGCGSRGSGSFIFDPTPIARQNLGLSGGIRAGSPVASTPVQTASYFGPTNASVPGYDSSQFGYGGTGFEGQGYWQAGGSVVTSNISSRDFDAIRSMAPATAAVGVVGVTGGGQAIGGGFGAGVLGGFTWAGTATVAAVTAVAGAMVLAMTTEVANGDFRPYYHYTTKKGLAGILASQSINPSLKANNPKDARYGDGVYVTDIPPGTMKNGKLSYQLFGVGYLGNRNAYYVGINAADFNVVPKRPHVYLIPTEVPLDISTRIFDTGAN